MVKKDLIENTGIPADKIHHVGGGSSIDVTKIDHSQKQGYRFLFVGNRWNIKNGDLVVAAFKKLSAMYPDRTPELYVAGPSEMPECIKGQDNIFFLGRLSHEDLIYYYNLCDYYVMPSKCDAYGLVFIEALCFGLPCIGKNLHAMPEFIQNGQNGYLIENDDVDELTDAMGRLLCNGQEIVRYVRDHKDYYINRYSWDSVADRIIQVLRQDGYLD